ncbi:hypothetical protein DIURU_001987 [Diutina rugosa]|uniref:Uncharacterized protein n=1 Tax=Diutina rugosa TaxID=5481 RepID=A0A642URA2_DIURU|nr:uncharacterized protein DIURU_001987 [Diutina rugosa]KAA8904035.1 hypothetical protein DIURU_001987 [Diutina rugosa]
MPINWDYEPEVIDSQRDDDSLVQKHGKISFRYISRPPQNFWFIRPHALNYFKDGVLHRTKGERSSSTLELFVDLLYVGLITNLAGEAAKESTGLSLLKYFLYFMPIWQVWCDIKDGVNYYYNEDFTQKLYVFFIIVLLMFYANSHSKAPESLQGAALTIVPYMIARVSLATLYLFYSCWIPQHRLQMRFYALSIYVTSCLWIIVIFVGNRAKVGVSIAIFALENASFIYAYSPMIKRTFKLTMSTALNLEHEIERFSAFVTVAIGEYPYKAVATAPIGAGFNIRLARGVFMLLIAYILFWIYNYGSTIQRRVHPLRRSATTACLFIYSHLPLIAAIVLSADASGDLIKVENGSTKRGATGLTHDEHQSAGSEALVLLKRSVVQAASAGEEESHNMFGLSFYFAGGIGVSLLSMWVLGMLFKDEDEKCTFVLPRWARIGWRLPVGVGIAMLPFAEMDVTLLMGMTSVMLGFVFIWESVFQTPTATWFKFNLVEPAAIAREEEEENRAHRHRQSPRASQEYEDTIEERKPSVSP